MARRSSADPSDLTDTERATLESWTRRRTTAHALAQRAGIVLACAAGQANLSVARELRVDEQTVGKWRSGLREAAGGLLDEPRPGAPRTIARCAGGAVVTLTLESKPRDATHWSTRSMAGAMGLRQHGQAHLARLRPAAASGGDVQALQRSAVHRQGARHRGPVPGAARPRARAVRGREVADPGAGSHPAAAAAWPGASRAAHATTTCAMAPRRCSPRWTSRRARSSANAIGVIARWSSGKFLDTSMPPSRRSSTFTSILDNYATHKTPLHPPLARQASAVPSALHAHGRLLAQPSGAVVRAR